MHPRRVDPTRRLTSALATCLLAVGAVGCAEPALEESYADMRAVAYWHSDSKKEFSPADGIAPVLLSRTVGTTTVQDLYWWVQDRSVSPEIARLYKKDTSIAGAPAQIVTERPGAAIEAFVRDFPVNPLVARLHWTERGADGKTRLVSLPSKCLKTRAAADLCFGADLNKVESGATGGALVIEHDGIEAFAIAPEGALRVIKGTDPDTGDHGFWLFDARGRSIGVNGAVNTAPKVAFTKATFPELDNLNDKWAASGIAEVASVAVDDRRNVYFCYGDELHRFGALDLANKKSKRLFESTLGFDPNHLGIFHEDDVRSPCRFVFVAGAARLLWASTAQADTWIFSAQLGSAQTMAVDKLGQTTSIFKPELDEFATNSTGKVSDKTTRILANDTWHFQDDAPITSMSLSYSSKQLPTLVYQKGDRLFRSVDEFVAAKGDQPAAFTDPALVWTVDRPIGSAAAIQRENKLTGQPAFYIFEAARDEDVSVCGGSTGCPTIKESFAGDLLQLSPAELQGGV